MVGHRTQGSLNRVPGASAVHSAGGIGEMGQRAQPVYLAVSARHHSPSARLQAQ